MGNDCWDLRWSIGRFCFSGDSEHDVIMHRENAQGELQGAIASTMSLGSIIGPIAMTFIFGAFTKNKEGATFIYFPGAPFILSFILSCIAIWIFIVTLKKYYKA